MPAILMTIDPLVLLGEVVDLILGKTLLAATVNPFFRKMVFLRTRIFCGWIMLPVGIKSLFYRFPVKES